MAHSPDIETAEADPATAAGPPDLSMLDRHLGDLVVEEEIARTALAAVLRVRTGAHGGRSVALKVSLHAADSEELARFRHEVRLLSEAPHPNVVEVHDCGALPGGFPFLTMELLSPQRVDEVFGAAAEAGDWDAFYALAIQAAAGLAHIHRQGVIHCDVKPSNLGLAPPQPSLGDEGEGPRLKILDFGLAQAVRRGLDARIRGTLAYVAPEVVLQDAYDQRADLYSLGLTLFELATGVLPSSGGDAAALAFHLGEERPDPRRLRPDMPAELAAILGTLLARDPQLRYATAGKLLVELGKAAKQRVDPAALATGGSLLSARLVGRDGVIGRLRAELSTAAEGRGRVVVVEGGEGMGKSRVLRELRLFAAVEGARVGFGRAVAGRGQPLSALFSALADVGVEVEPPPAASGEEGERGERYRLYRRLAAALRHEVPPDAGQALVLLLDDLQRSDDGAEAGGEGAELLAFLAAELADLPVLVVASRAAAASAAGVEGTAEVETLEISLDDVEEAGAGDGSPAVVALSLPPLTARQSRELTDACLGSADLPDALYELV
ncbi:MAG TPA: serine/threonine-protein kinase, partial [Thermoanaerobaculia bacterium]|nr:serine/threonine-protein kinase [Thermoanaerobaculia bacterium]